MFYGDSVNEIRQQFYTSFRKYLNQETLLPLEEEVVKVILDHPEYHALFRDLTRLETSFYPELGETNPFLHLGLHLAIREQLATKRPAGIEGCFNQLLLKHQDPLTVEHLMMEQLAHCLWMAQRNNRPPDEEDYLNALVGLCNE